MDTVRNSVLLPDELYIALSRFLRYQQEHNKAASWRHCSESDSDETLDAAYVKHTYHKNYQSIMRSNKPNDATDPPNRKPTPSNHQDVPEAAPKLPYPQEFWNTVQPQTSSVVRHSSDRRARSLSAPASRTESQRECLRGVDNFCHVQPEKPINYLGLQPTGVYGKPEQPTPTIPTRDCSACPNRPGSSNAYTVPSNVNPYDSMRSQSTNQSSDTVFDQSYEKWLRQQNQRQQQQQPGYSTWQRNDQSLDNFEPALNSTMIASRAPSKQQQQQQQLLQQQQQQQQLQQQHRIATCKSSAVVYDPNQGQSYPACCMKQRQPASVPSQAQYPCQQRPATAMEMQRQQAQQCETPDSYDNTVYVQMPPAQPQRPPCLRPNIQQPTNVTFSDQYMMASAASRTQPASDSWPSTSRNTCYPPIVAPPCRPATVLPNQATTSRLMPFNDNSTPEERYIQRTNTLFFNALVMDQSCPGIIQSSLDGVEDFNAYAFDIAFAGSIPEKPYPIDPITMLEAIKLRIDYEREEIRKRCPSDAKMNAKEKSKRDADSDNLSDSSKDGLRKSKGKDKEKEKGRYYSGTTIWKKQKKAGDTKSTSGKTSMSREISDIDRHFASKNKSEVNDGVLAFLKAENSYKNGPTPTHYNDISADIHSHESNFFGLPIKMKIYTATTWPTE
ncbi:PDZ and LIM domain protein Zasp isoform X2 [Drosophila virilis]|uniref:PDZ and LIM domain protein Zasp isoform X2 n=1 Tax=Drosophila virilis TaxID=7244 RepID=UPI00139607E9|nr:general transcriptional corepressor CYC8 isoform X2 [Drosophila virilis]